MQKWAPKKNMTNSFNIIFVTQLTGLSLTSLLICSFRLSPYQQRYNGANFCSKMWKFVGIRPPRVWILLFGNIYQDWGTWGMRPSSYIYRVSHTLRHGNWIPHAMYLVNYPYSTLNQTEWYIVTAINFTLSNQLVKILRYIYICHPLARFDQYLYVFHETSHKMCRSGCRNQWLSRGNNGFHETFHQGVHTIVYDIATKHVVRLVMGPDDQISRPLYSTGYDFNTVWISNYTHCKKWDVINYPFLNFNGAAVDDYVRQIYASLGFTG